MPNWASSHQLSDRCCRVPLSLADRRRRRAHATRGQDHWEASSYTDSVHRAPSTHAAHSDEPQFCASRLRESNVCDVVDWSGLECGEFYATLGPCFTSHILTLIGGLRYRIRMIIASVSQIVTCYRFTILQPVYLRCYRYNAGYLKRLADIHIQVPVVDHLHR